MQIVFIWKMQKCQKAQSWADIAFLSGKFMMNFRKTWKIIFKYILLNFLLDIFDDNPFAHPQIISCWQVDQIYEGGFWDVAWLVNRYVSVLK